MRISETRSMFFGVLVITLGALVTGENLKKNILSLRIYSILSEFAISATISLGCLVFHACHHCSIIDIRRAVPLASMYTAVLFRTPISADNYRPIYNRLAILPGFRRLSSILPHPSLY